MFEKVAAASLGGVTATYDRMDEYGVVGVMKSSAGANFLIGALALFDVLHRISPRDKFELQFDLDGNSETVAEVSSSARERVEEHFRKNVGFSEMSYSLNIWKKVEKSTLSIYSLDAFSYYVAGESLKQLLGLVGERFADRLIFECFESIAEFGTGTIQFLSPAKLAAFSPTIRDRVSELAVLKENSYAIGIDSSLIPSDLNLTTRSSYPALNEFFDLATAALSVVFLANSSVLHDGDELEYKLVGYKSIVGRLSIAKLSASTSALYRIYSWAYSAGGNSDRIGLARNVISLHVECLDLIGEGAGLWNAIQSNYQIYLKGNISAYLEVKSRIAELLVEASASAHTAARSLVASLKGGVGVMGAFLLGVVVVNGVKDAGFEGIFSPLYLFVLALIMVVFSAWLWSEIGATRRALIDSQGAIEDVVVAGYSKILARSEIDESLKAVADRNARYVQDEVKRVRLIWVYLCVALVTFFSVGALVVAESSASKPAGASSKPVGMSALPGVGVTGCVWPNVPLILGAGRTQMDEDGK